MAQASPDYVFVPISHTMVPETAAYPNRPLVVGLGALIGLIFGSAGVVTRYILLRER